jgi:sigma-B regulation protein RsbU (phosphoserine phosphatase)
MLGGLCYGIGAQTGGAADLGEAAGELNRYLVSKSGLEKFVSVVFGTLWADGRLAYVNAGHNPPLVIRGAGTVELLREHGLIMGMFDEAEYRASEVRLAPGEILVLYSDGITEARARDGERFGVERLKEAARGAGVRSPKEIHDAILAETDSFTRSAPPGDDVTLMAVKYLGRS